MFNGVEMTVQEIAEKLVKRDNLIRAHDYDFHLRGDGDVELIGYVPDPTLDIKDFEGREMLFPKRWLTLAVYHESEEINV
jgi:hypothetical protein